MSLQARSVLSVAILLTFATTCPADTKSHRKAAEELLKATGVETQLEHAIDQSLDAQIKVNPAIAPFREVMKKFFAKHMSWESLKEEMITIYTDVFTEKELNDIKAFYQTPTGKKMAQKMPELLGKGMQLGVKRVQDNQEELRSMIQAEAARPK